MLRPGTTRTSYGRVVAPPWTLPNFAETRMFIATSSNSCYQIGRKSERGRKIWNAKSANKMKSEREKKRKKNLVVFRPSETFTYPLCSHIWSFQPLPSNKNDDYFLCKYEGQPDDEKQFLRKDVRRRPNWANQPCYDIALAGIGVGNLACNHIWPRSRNAYDVT